MAENRLSGYLHRSVANPATCTRKSTEFNLGLEELRVTSCKISLQRHILHTKSNAGVTLDKFWGKKKIRKPRKIIRLPYKMVV